MLHEETHVDEFGTYISTEHSILEHHFDRWMLNLVTNKTTIHVTRLLRGESPAAERQEHLYEYDPEDGSITKEVQNANDMSVSATRRFQNDKFGQALTFTAYPTTDDSDPRVHHNEYDSTCRMNTAIVDVLGHRTTFTYDPATGHHLTQTGPNGLTTYFHYDEFGRHIASDLPTGQRTEEGYQWCDKEACEIEGQEWDWMRWSTNNLGQVSMRYFSAAYNQQKPVVIVDFPLNRTDCPVYTIHERDGLGRLARTSERYFGKSSCGSPSAPKWTTIEYDKWHRPVNTTKPDGSIERIEHDGLRKSHVNSLGQNTTHINNCVKGLVRTIDAAGTDMDIARTADGKTWRVSFGGKLLLQYIYNTAGNVIETYEANSGTTRAKFNAWGKHSRQTNALGQISTWDYDESDRLTRRESPDGITTWEYDTEYVDEITKIEHKSQGLSYSQQFKYDKLGKVIRHIHVLDGETYTFETEHDENQREMRLTWPSGVSAVPGYRGESIVNYTVETDDAFKTVVWQGQTIDAKKRWSEIDYDGGSFHQTLYDWQRPTMLKGVRTTVGQRVLQDLTWKHDTRGNVVERGDQCVQKTLGSSCGVAIEAVQYDELNRMVSLSSSVANATRTFKWDRLSRQVSSSRTGTYAYDEDSRPHAPASISDGPQAGKFTYDAAGNLKNFKANVGFETAFEFTSFRQVKQVNSTDGSAEYFYGPNRELLRRIEMDTTGEATITTHIGKHLEIVQTGDSVIERHYLGYNHVAVMEVHRSTKADRPVKKFRGLRPALTVAGSDATVYWLLHDRLKSVSHLVGSGGVLLEARSYDEFGQPRAADWTPLARDECPATNRTHFGWATHRSLPLGLTHMPARTYLSDVALFTAADPTNVDVSSLQKLNRYLYADGNPLTRLTQPVGSAPEYRTDTCKPDG